MKYKSPTPPSSIIEFRKILKTFNKDMREANLMFDEMGWANDLETFILKVEKRAYKAGRQSILDEYKAEQAKLLKGFKHD